MSKCQIVGNHMSRLKFFKKKIHYILNVQEELLVSCIPKDLMTSMKEDLTRKMMSKIPRITPFHDLYVKHHSDVR